jgi:hypothetical protein
MTGLLLKGTVTAAQLRQRLLLLRFINYIGVQLCALLVPLLVYKLTNNLGLAGLAILVEWAPKLLLYCGGGALIQCLSAKRVHVGLEVLRITALLVLLATVLGYGNLWMVALAAASYQASNALANVLFEVNVTHHWPASSRTRAYTTFFRNDHLACVSALTLSMVISTPLIIVLVALFIQSSNLALVLMSTKHLYAHKPEVMSPTTAHQHLAMRYMRQLKTDIRHVCQPRLLGLSLSVTLLGIPGAMLFSAPVFYLHEAQSHIPNITALLSVVLLLKNILGASVLSYVNHALARGQNDRHLALSGMTGLLICVAMAAVPSALLPAIIAMLGVGLFATMYIPWLRKNRQDLLSELVPESSRPGVTGMLISVEASSYLLAGGVLALSGTGHIGVALCAAGALAVLGAIMIGVQTREPQTMCILQQPPK